MLVDLGKTSIVIASAAQRDGAVRIKLRNRVIPDLNANVFASHHSVTRIREGQRNTTGRREGKKHLYVKAKQTVFFKMLSSFRP